MLSSIKPKANNKQKRFQKRRIQYSDDTLVVRLA